MSQEMAESLSAEILGEMGLGQKDQARGADHGPPAPEDDNQSQDGDEGSPAGDTPQDHSEDGSDDGDKGGTPGVAAAWMKTLPEAVQADLSRLSPETVAQLREMAEGGLRQDDYTRKTQKLQRELAEAEKVKELADFARSLLSDPDKAKLLRGERSEDSDSASESEDDLIEKLMEERDPQKFARGLRDFIRGEIKKGAEESTKNSPQARAARVNAAADQIHEAIRDKIPEGAWERACELYEDQCQQEGVAWYDTPVEKLALALRPHLRFAIAEQLSRQGAGQSQPQGESQGESGKSKPVEKPGPRAAAMPSSGSGAPTKVVPKHVREGREISEDEAFKATMERFGLSEDELSKLRVNSA